MSTTQKYYPLATELMTNYIPYYFEEEKVTRTYWVWALPDSSTIHEAQAQASYMRRELASLNKTSKEVRYEVHKKLLNAEEAKNLPQETPSLLGSGAGYYFCIKVVSKESFSTAVLPEITSLSSYLAKYRTILPQEVINLVVEAITLLKVKANELKDKR